MAIPRQESQTVVAHVWGPHIFTLRFKFDINPLLKNLPRRTMRADIYNDAENTRGFHYFRAVDRGRRAVFPIRARALRIEFPDGVKFAMRARASRSARIISRALRWVKPILRNLATHYPPTTFGARAFLDNAAGFIVMALRRYTPQKTGKLRERYRIERRP